MARIAWPKTAVVTGASAGLGREIVRQLVRDRGMRVLATARRAERLRELADEWPPGAVEILPGDLADAGFRAALWDHAERLFPEGVDLLFNNAGLGYYGDFAEQAPDSVRRIFEVNVFALFDLTQRASRSMKARGRGQIVQISSVLGFVGLPYSAAYVASKHAVNGLVRSIRYELRGSGVRVWAACPGRTESEFFSVALDGVAGERRGPNGDSTEKVVRGIVRGIDRRAAFVFPSTLAWATVEAARLLPGAFDGFMTRWAPGFFRREIDTARGEVNRSSVP